MPSDQERDRRIDKLEWRADAIDEWRNGPPGQPGSGVDGRLALVESEVNTIKATRQLQEAVSQAGQRERRREHELRLTALQKAAGAFLGLLTAADLIRSLIFG